MFDYDRREAISTVGQLKRLLKNIPDDAELHVCCDSMAWFHVEYDNSVVNLDIEELDDAYEDSGSV